jgi:hypothetical protein
MNGFRKKRGFLFAAILSAPLAGFAGRGDSPRFDLFVAYGLVTAGGATTYQNSYDPHPEYEIPGSFARQTLAIEPASGGRFSAGGTWYFRRSLGIRPAFLSESRPIGGLNSPYECLYLYTSMAPPDYTPVETGYARQLGWPSTEGRIREWSGRLELVWRLPVSSAFEIVLSGGPSITSVSGRLHPLGFTEFQLGGHGVLFVEDYLVYLRLPAQTKIGAAFGVEASLRLSGHFWFRLGAGYRLIGSYEATPEIDKVLYYDSLEDVAAETAELVEDRFHLQALRLSLSRVFFGAGIAVRI